MFLSMAIAAIATLSAAYVRSYPLFLATRFQYYHTFVHLREPVECYVAEFLCKGGVGRNTAQLHNLFFYAKILCNGGRWGGVSANSAFFFQSIFSPIRCIFRPF